MSQQHQQRRIAVFVDGDNLSSSLASDLLDATSRLGDPFLRRVYGRTEGLRNWADAHGFRLCNAGTGANGADLLLAVEAMELALTDPPDSFVIASADRDFTPLVIRLRERGFPVLCLDVAADALRAAASGILSLPARQPSAPARPTPIDLKIREILSSQGIGQAGLPIARLGAAMYARHGTRISTHAARTWRGYLSQKSELYDLDPRGPQARVRLRSDGWAL